jgi:HlyD family secretion protein
MMHKAIYLILIAAVLVAGMYFLVNDRETDQRYRVGEVSRGDVVLGISATGTLNPVTSVQVGSQVSGTIAKLYADFNDQVKEGQLLAQLDPTFLQATVSEQRANVNRAEAQVNESERNFGRISDLFAKAFVSQAEMDAATTALESARANLMQARAALERAEVNLRYATIRSPISGVVISRDVDVGQTVAASLQAPTLFTIGKDLKEMQVEVTVDEADIGSVREGQYVSFRVDAFPDDFFEGTVSQVRLGPTLNQNVVTYTVIVAVRNPDLRLLPGMTATVTIEVARRNDVLRIPVQALRFKPQIREGEEAGARLGNPRSERQEPPNKTKRQSNIWVLKDGEPSAVKAVIGLQDLQFAELVETDLKEGDEVIIGSEEGLNRTAQAPQNPFQPQMPGGRRRSGGF